MSLCYDFQKWTMISFAGVTITTIVINFEYYPAVSLVTAFFICPDCRKKFVINIQDLGKVTERIGG